MDISDLVETLAKIGGLSKKEQERLEKILTQLDEMDDFEGLDITDIDDLFDIEAGLGPRPGKRSTDDFRQQSPESPDTTIDVESAGEDRGYFGEEWIQFGEKYHAFVEIDDLDESKTIDIKLRDGTIMISDPVDEKIEIEMIPDDINNIDAEQTNGNRLVIKVW